MSSVRPMSASSSSPTASPISTSTTTFAATSRRSAEQDGDQEQRAADAGANQRAGDADVVEVGAEREFQTVDDRARLPALDGIADELPDLAAPRYDHSECRFIDGGVEAGAHRDVARQGAAEREQPAGDRLARLGIGQGQIGEDDLAQPVPQRGEPDADLRL